MSLETAIKQDKFSDEPQKVAVNLLYTASWFSTELARVLKPFGMSWQQFNIMRILRGQRGKPVTLKLVSERMIDRMSNTSRLVDKLVAKGYVVRTIDQDDRRQVALTLTSEGHDHLEAASESVTKMTQCMIGHVCHQRLSDLNNVLDSIREKQSN